MYPLDPESSWKLSVSVNQVTGIQSHEVLAMEMTESPWWCTMIYNQFPTETFVFYEIFTIMDNTISIIFVFIFCKHM